jgi:NSS family neurotransmitter:Na+ symporter
MGVNIQGVALAQPMVAFLEDEIGLTRRKAAIVLGIFWFLSSHICIYLRGGWQVMDFWAGTFGPPLLAFLEVVIMMWILVEIKYGTRCIEVLQ